MESDSTFRLLTTHTEAITHLQGELSVAMETIRLLLHEVAPSRRAHVAAALRSYGESFLAYGDDTMQSEQIRSQVGGRIAIYAHAVEKGS